MDPREALARLGPRACASHGTAATLWGIELVEEHAPRLTVPLQRSRVVLPGWQVRRLDLPADDVVVVQGVRLTTPARTVLDLAHVLPLDQAVASADSAVRKGLTDADALLARLGTRRGRGCDRPRAVAPLVDPAAGSVLESLLRVLLHLAGLPAPRTQHAVHERDGSFLARVDFAWPSARLVVEADGFAFHSDREAYRSDRRRTKRSSGSAGGCCASPGRTSSAGRTTSSRRCGPACATPHDRPASRTSSARPSSSSRRRGPASARRRQRAVASTTCR